MLTLEEFKVLNCLDIKHRIKDIKTFLPRTNLPENKVSSILKKFEKNKLATFKEFWEITKNGQKEAKSYRSQKYKGCKSALSKIYTEEFLKLDKILKSIITDWQMKTVDGKFVPNTHNDPAYDRAVMERLYNFHNNEAKQLYKKLDQMVPHLNYTDMFEFAVSKIKGGDYTYLAKPDIDSYHTVWFELHEDILRTANIEREE